LIDKDIISRLLVFGNLLKSSWNDKVHVALITAAVIAILRLVRIWVVSPASELAVADAADVLLFRLRHSLFSFLSDSTYNVIDLINCLLSSEAVIKLRVWIAIVICRKMAAQNSFDLVLERIVVELFSVVDVVRHSCSP
jgi:hypothetical protein